MALNSQLALLTISIVSSLTLLPSFSTTAQEIEAASAPAVSQISTAPTSNPSTSFSSTDQSSLTTTTTTTSLLAEEASSNLHMDMDSKAMLNKIEKNMMVTMQKTEDFLKVIKKRLAASPGASPSKECLKTCIEVYEEAIDGLQKSIEDLSSRNFYKVNVDISAVSTDMDTCDECYVEMLGEDPELKKFDLWVEGITSEWLGDLETVSG